MTQRKCQSFYAQAKDNQWELFTVEELALILNLSRDAILCCKSKGARFPFGKSRPEWLHEFLLTPGYEKLQCKDTVPRPASNIVSIAPKAAKKKQSA